MSAGRRAPFVQRLSWLLAALLLAFGLVLGLLGLQLARQHESESLQRLSHGLARHIVEHWPEMAPGADDRTGPAARQALLGMLMTVNPGIQVYLLDAQGRVDAYIGEPGMVRQHQVDLAPLRRFLAGAPLPLRGTDPMGGDDLRLFSVAMFPPRAGERAPPGYLYVVLDGAARQRVSAQLGPARTGLWVAGAAGVGGLVILALGGFTLHRMTRPLRRLAGRMQAYSAAAGPGTAAATGDEVQAIAQAFDDMTRRIEAHAAAERAQAAEHRETMAGIAHDLRTPLTALHGHLEALASDALATAEQRPSLLAAALAQSDKVRRLSQQLFELASLQATDQVLQRERFCLDELVGDAVQKFHAHLPRPALELTGPDPGRLELEGDLQLVERALTNLIDNALRHAGRAGPVRVSLRRDGLTAEVLIEDRGPGLPAELHERLQQGRSLRDPPLRRSGGGIGGLGLAIAQRVAQLHGGSLQPRPAPAGGTLLCLALPLAR